ncbi:MAG: hypothetical protein IJ629_00065 [Clostridia bacterium]|nr:hypothetical protein [Clostridia bacterium]
MLSIMKKFAVMAAGLVAMMVMFAMPIQAYAANSVIITINGDNNSVVIYDDYNGNTQSHNSSQITSIPSNARKVYVWSQGEQRATAYLVDNEVYLASYDDVRKVFPSETRTWQQVSTTGITPLYMWCDGFGYTYKIEANNVFLFQSGIADNSGEPIVAKPYPIYVDGKRISNVVVYLSDEDATAFAGKDELKKIFVANANAIVCNEVAHYTVNFWADKFDYEMTIESSFVNLVKKTAPPTVTPAVAPDVKPSPENVKPSITPAPASENYTAKTYKVMVENKLTTFTAKTKMVNNKEKTYVTKAQANKILKQFGKSTTVKKSIEISSLAKKCGATAKTKGSYIYLIKKGNISLEIRFEKKVINSKKSIIQSKNGNVFVSSDILKKFGMNVNYNSKSGNVTVVKGKKVMQFAKGSKVYYNTKGTKCKIKVAPYVSSKKIMLPIVTVVRGFGYSVYAESEPGFARITVSTQK